MLNIYKQVIALACTCFFLSAKSQTNKGTEFWVGYGHHEFMEPGCTGSPAGANNMNMRIYLSNSENTVANVTITLDSSGSAPGLWYRRTYTVNPNSVIETGNLPKGAVDAINSSTDPSYDARLLSDPPPAGTGGEGIFRGKGIHIQSDVPIVAYAHIYGSASSGAAMLLPVDAWGDNYATINSEQKGYSKSYNWMYVIAKEDNTVIEITPSVLSRLGKQAWIPFQVTLMKGQIYQLIGDAVCSTGTGVQLTGTKVRSFNSKPIAVFAGSSRTGGEETLCGGTSSKDNDMQQCFPKSSWGKKYLTAPASTSTGTTLNTSTFQKNVYKVLVDDRTTIVRRNGFILNDSMVSVVIKANTTSVCPGTPVTFTAIPKNGGTNPVFEWKLNGVVVGITLPVLILNNLSNGDVVRCTLISNASCVLIPTAQSNIITVTVANTVVPTIAVYGTTDSLCTGNPIRFTALATNAGSSPNYQWQVNGANDGTNSSIFTPSTLSSGNTVSCTLISSASCVTSGPPISFSSNTLTLLNGTNLVSSVSISASSNSVCPGTAVTFTAKPKNGGLNPLFQWFIGSQSQGTASTSNLFTTSSLTNGQLVSCVMTANGIGGSTVPACGLASSVTSNVIAMTVGGNIIPSVTIYASSESLCGGGPVVFNAVITNGGTSPSCQWYLGPQNGTTYIVGANTETYTGTALANGDKVHCTINSSDACATIPSATSNVIIMGTSGLINNSYYAYTSSTADYIEANKPVAVAQFMSNAGTCSAGNGDPEMIYLSPIEQGTNKTILYRTNAENILTNHITLVIPTAGLTSLKINNSAVFSHIYPHPNLSGYTVVCQNWTASKAQVTINSDSAFTGYTYGLGGAESYGYNIGATFGVINNIVPVTLIDFSASRIQNDIVVNWKTANEINFDGFEVQRSLDATNFNVAANIVASKAGLYSFNDKNAAKDFASAKTLYYRLKMVDKDGSAKYSAIVSIKLDKNFKSSISVYPNPFVNEIKLRINTENAGLANISINDISGKLLDNRSMFIPKGSNLISLDNLEKLNKGVYVLSVQINGHQEYYKLMK
jgi:hypothetical protein